MSIRSMTSIHTIQVLKPAITQGDALGVVRTFNVVRTLETRVKPVSATQAAFFAQNSMEVDHNLWFDSDPQLTEGDMILWVVQGQTITMRITRTANNLHGLDRLWMAGAKAMRIDNLKINTGPNAPLT